MWVHRDPFDTRIQEPGMSGTTAVGTGGIEAFVRTTRYSVSPMKVLSFEPSAKRRALDFEPEAGCGNTVKQ